MATSHGRRARQLHEHKAVIAHALRQHAGIPYEVEQHVCSDCQPGSRRAHGAPRGRLARSERFLGEAGVLAIPRAASQGEEARRERAQPPPAPARPGSRRMPLRERPRVGGRLEGLVPALRAEHRDRRRPAYFGLLREVVLAAAPPARRRARGRAARSPARAGCSRGRRAASRAGRAAARRRRSRSGSADSGSGCERDASSRRPRRSGRGGRRRRRSTPCRPSSRRRRPDGRRPASTTRSGARAPEPAVAHVGVDHRSPVLLAHVDLRLPRTGAPRRRPPRRSRRGSPDARRPDAVVAEVARREDDRRADRARRAAHVVDRGRGEPRERPAVVAAVDLGAADERLAAARRAGSARGRRARARSRAGPPPRRPACRR